MVWSVGARGGLDRVRGPLWDDSRIADREPNDDPFGIEGPCGYDRCVDAFHDPLVQARIVGAGGGVPLARQGSPAPRSTPCSGPDAPRYLRP